MIKWIFHIFNTLFLVLYLYPGSILGYLIYGNLNKQPQISIDLIVSSNHVYAFFLLSFLGLLSFNKNSKKKNNYLFIFIIYISRNFSLNNSK